MNFKGKTQCTKKLQWNLRCFQVECKLGTSDELQPKISSLPWQSLLWLNALLTVVLWTWSEAGTYQRHSICHIHILKDQIYTFHHLRNGWKWKKRNLLFPNCPYYLEYLPRKSSGCCLSPSLYIFPQYPTFLKALLSFPEMETWNPHPFLKSEPKW